MMLDGEFFDLMREGLWVGVEMSAPILITALIVGVLVGLVQALTSIQEMTLTFVPKLAAMVAIFWVTMAYMTDSLVAFFTDTLLPMIGRG
ncbi:MAG: flagellar biosynthetic protein FliQ [Pseudomonadota bacterium]